MDTSGLISAQDVPNGVAIGCAWMSMRGMEDVVLVARWSCGLSDMLAIRLGMRMMAIGPRGEFSPRVNTHDLDCHASHSDTWPATDGLMQCLRYIQNMALDNRSEATSEEGPNQSADVLMYNMHVLKRPIMSVWFNTFRYSSSRTLPSF